MRLPRSFLIIAALAASLASSAMAQEPAPPAPNDTSERRAELDAVTHDIEITADRQAALQKEIDALDKDRASLNQSLIDGSREVQKLEGDIDAAEKRLSSLLDQEDKLRASLNERRGVLSEVLAALQRIGHRPPPALLVRPEDALDSIHSAILLGAIVPELRAAALALSNDLKDLVAVRAAKENERDTLRANAQALAEGRARISLLIEERQNQRDASAAQLQQEQQRAGVLADQATSLRDLIARMEAENATAAKAAAEAAKATEVAKADTGDKAADSLGDSGRLTPKVAFANTKGLLPMPANGTEIKAFGDPDGLGGKAQGISLATREGAQVSSPSDGWVVYSGPFRSYGQLLIINAGDGYHVLLAGMERIDVQLGQFVLAGEPVAVMASTRLASAGAVNVGVTQPVLYIEFRKDGASIDPAPWWAAPNVEKVGG
jgi:septal ring factor EnvC (AmiA/AmiB activator)